MKEPIKVIEQDGKQVVNARDLYSFLGIGKDFSNWIKDRIEKYDFQEGIDFTPILAKNPKQAGKGDYGRGRPSKEYAITLDMAKELSMVENNQRGREARQYFIEREKLSRQNLIDFKDAASVLQLAQSFYQEQVLRKDAEEKVRKLLPKAEFAQKVLDTETMVDIGQTAKILELPFGRNTLFKHLRERGIFFKNRNEPKQTYVERGYFFLKEHFVEPTNHDPFVVIKVLVTQKGLEYIAKLFGVIPTSKSLALLK